MTPYRGKHNHPFRRLCENLLDKALLKGWVAKWAHRCKLHGTVRVTEHSLALPPGRRLPQPLKVAFASDFHAGPTTHPAVFATLFEHIAAHQPDVLLLGGDFVSGKAEYVTALSEGLANCQPPLGKFAVFGNHDLWTDDALLHRELGAAGVEMLVNRNVALPEPFASVSVCGLDDPWTGEADAARAFAGAGPTRILLMHAPDGLLLLDGETFDLGLAGHTHAGQVTWREGSPIVVPSGPLCRKYCCGHYQIEQNGSLIVSRGVGCSSLPLRINADPELVLCTLS